MKMNSTTRARSSLVALVVLALVFVALSAIAYPSLSSEGDEPGRETDKNGRTYTADGTETGDDTTLIRGIGGYVFLKSGDPVQGAEVTLSVKPVRPLPPDNTNPDVNENGEYRKGTRGEDGDPDRPGNENNEKNSDGRRITDDEPVPKTRKLVTKTDRAGFFQFNGMGRGEYLLQVLRGDRIVHSTVLKYDGAGSRPMKIILGGDQGKDGFIVKGRVVDERKQPVAGARIQLFRIMNDPMPRPMVPGNGYDEIKDMDGNLQNVKDDNSRPIILPPPAMKTTTDREGNFAFRNVEEGGYTLTVEAKGFHPYKTQLRIHEDTRAMVMLKHLPQRDDDRKTFTLHATPVDGDGDSIHDDVMVVAWGKEGKPLGGVMIYVDGIYQGATIFEGWLLSRDYEPGTHQVKGILKNQYAQTTFVVKGREPRPDPDPEPREFGYLKGIVYSAGEPMAPVPGAKLELVNHDFHAETKTGQGGEFIFERVPEGGYVIHAFAEGYHEYKGEVLIEGNEITELEIVLEEEPAHESGSLQGIVVDVDGEPIINHQGIAVAIHEFLDILYETKIDGHGNFYFQQLAEGKYNLRVEMEGFHPGTATIEVLPGETVTITIMLRPMD